MWLVKINILALQVDMDGTTADSALNEGFKPPMHLMLTCQEFGVIPEVARGAAIECSIMIFVCLQEHAMETTLNSDKFLKQVVAGVSVYNVKVMVRFARIPVRHRRIPAAVI